MPRLPLRLSLDTDTDQLVVSFVCPRCGRDNEAVLDLGRLRLDCQTGDFHKTIILFPRARKVQLEVRP